MALAGLVIRGPVLVGDSSGRGKVLFSLGSSSGRGSILFSLVDGSVLFLLVDSSGRGRVLFSLGKSSGRGGQQWTRQCPVLAGEQEWMM